MNTKMCPTCKELKPADAFYFYKAGRRAGTSFHECKACGKIRHKSWWENHPTYTSDRRHACGEVRPMSEARDCTMFLGTYIAEKILSEIFENVTTLPPNNPDFDFICKNGFKIDCKSSCLHKKGDVLRTWEFQIRHNMIADYFLCLAFDNRENLEPMHVWLIPGYLVNDHIGIGISDTTRALTKWSKYELPIDQVKYRCDAMKDANPEMIR